MKDKLNKIAMQVVVVVFGIMLVLIIFLLLLWPLKTLAGKVFGW